MKIDGERERGVDGAAAAAATISTWFIQSMCSSYYRLSNTYIPLHIAVSFLVLSMESKFLITRQDTYVRATYETCPIETRRPNNVAARILEGNFYALPLAEG